VHHQTIVKQRDQQTETGCVDRVHEACLKQKVERLIEMNLRVAECFDNDLKHVTDFRTLDH